MLEPNSIDELQDAVRDHSCVLPVGGLTKSRLSLAPDECQLISMRKLSGITEYDPSEYTFTALAGTPVEEIHQAVDAKGQFLPCSALLRKSGATLGGSIASGLSGSGRFRFGGLRDFLLGIRYISGDARIVSAGGKVVKNAAGFDLPKFMVGSLGRYGVLTEVTFKVFPKPSSTVTLKVTCDSHEQAVERLFHSASSRWELYAVDYVPGDFALHLRVGGSPEPIQAIADEIANEWSGQTEQLTAEEGETFWGNIREFSWISEGAAVAKIPVTPKVIPKLQAAIEEHDGLRGHYSVAGNVAFIATADTADIFALESILNSMSLRGLTIIGDAEAPLWLGEQPSDRIGAAVKHALDPQRRFLSIDA